ncbi:uncharacterized protein LOC122257123 [Penaeus japonicus]|uniref:uncharacterized protein LOC122257123 n=1 Tax=Penaeus japonicus TaxID=27405 RepID=UPI001C715788|nr:uncharacterized protein LOC122257123 [Penaeus japonicus]
MQRLCNLSRSQSRIEESKDKDSSKDSRTKFVVNLKRSYSEEFQIMINVLTLLAVVAVATPLPAYISVHNGCLNAEDVIVCEADFKLCSDVFANDEAEGIDENIHEVCLNETGLTHAGGHGNHYNFTGLQQLPLFVSGDMQRAVQFCIQYKREGVRPDGTIDPQPLLERLTLALNDTRPDIVERLHNNGHSCSTEKSDEWKACLLSHCILGNATILLPPTTGSPEEE